MQNPIDKAMKARLAGARTRLKEAVGLLQKCKACGIDVAEREEALAFLFDKLDAITREFVGTDPRKISMPESGNG